MHYYELYYRYHIRLSKYYISVMFWRFSEPKLPSFTVTNVLFSLLQEVNVESPQYISFRDADHNILFGYNKNWEGQFDPLNKTACIMITYVSPLFHSFYQVFQKATNYCQFSHFSFLFASFLYTQTLKPPETQLRPSRYKNDRCCKLFPA